jgi:hypothetical protein
MHIIGTELTATEDGYWGGAIPDHMNSAMPAGSHLVKATLVVDEVFTSAGSATLTIGTYKSDGAAVDADGIDATIAITAIDAVGDVIACNGAQINTVVLNTAPTGSVNDGVYLSALFGTAAFTAGKARLILEYVQGV